MEGEIAMVTRRTFVGATAAAAPLMAQQPAGAPNPNTSEQRRGTIQETPPFHAPLEFTRKDVPLRVSPFPMTQVRILGGVYADALEWNRGYMNRLDADRLVHNFRLTAGLSSNAKPLGGWEQYTPGRDGELRGHFTGHYLSACGLIYASTGDQTLKAKGDAIVDELAKCQAKLEGGYLSAYPTEWYDRLAKRERVWAPYYTMHKIMAGMLDMYQYAGNKQALQVLEKMSDWVDHWTGSKSEEHMQNILNTEYGGMNELLYNLAAVTNNDKWAKVGDRFTKKRFLDPLALHKDELRGLHTNTHIPIVIGAARRYELSGDPRFRTATDFFWDTVTKSRTYVNGGTSNGEGWLVGPDQLASELKIYAATAECCCAYNMMKLARQIYSWTADPRIFDYYERTLLNHRIGTIQPKTGYTQYYLSLTPGAWKTFNNEDQSFWCCTGTGVEEFSKLNDSIYWRDQDGLYVNLYMPSSLHWPERGLRLRQDTKFPESPSSTLTVTVDRPVQMQMRLRVPEWLTSGGSVKINGKTVEAFASPGSYLTLSRIWNNGDKVEIALPMSLRIEAMDDDAKTQAILYGPLVLAGDLGTEGLTPELIVGPNSPRMRAAGQVNIPSFKSSGSGPSSWIKPADAPLKFRTTGQTTDVTLAPLNSIFGRRYSVYWQVA